MNRDDNREGGGRAPERFALAFSCVAAAGGWAFFGADFGLSALSAGILFAADVAVLRMIVSAFTKPERSGKISGARAGLLFFIKIAVLGGVAVFLIVFARLDILGFTTGLTAGVVGIITAGLISKSGTF